MFLQSFKTKLDLNNKQKTLMAKHAGVARHAYNWGLSICNEALESKAKIPSSIDLHKRLVSEVKSANPWYYEVSKCSPQQALRNLSQAFTNWLKNQHTQKPKFKKKGHKDSFYLDGTLKIFQGNKIQLPRIGIVKCHEILPSVQPKNVTISRKADDWYISFKYEFVPKPIPKVRERIGVDVGINALATCSDKTVFPNVKAYRKYQQKLKHLQRELSRKQKGSKNREKAKRKLAKLHRKTACIRQDALHKLTTWLAKNHSEIVIENLNVSGMLKNHRLASAIADCGFYEFKRQLEYKCDWYGTKLIIADRFYPSTQLCSDCGNRQKMSLNQRTYNCLNCSMSLDRDLNAAINLEKYTASFVGCACGGLKTLNSNAVKDSVKQEVNNKTGLSNFGACFTERKVILMRKL